jgi:sugar phosphate isomerase/epimerase
MRVPEAELFATARQLGFDGVELSFGVYGAEERTIYQPGGPAVLRRQAAEQGMEIPSLFAGYFMHQEWTDGNGEMLRKPAEVLGRLIDGCAEANIPMLRLPFLGKSWRGSQHQHMLDILRPLLDRAATQNVILGLDSLLSADDLKTMLRRYQSPALRVCYDVGNARAAGRDVVSELKLLSDVIGQVQIKDRDRREPFASVPLGQGLVDLRAAMVALGEIRYDRWLILDTPSGDDPLATARQNLDFLRGLSESR